jgi:predicted amidohydrolase YtcJ
MRVSADRIFTGGPVITVDALRPVAEAVAVIGQRIFAVGSRDEIFKFRGTATEVVDLVGATLMPGFVEPHGHPIMTGAAWGDPVVDIRAIHTPTYDAAIAKIKRRVAKAKPGEFLWFLGLDPALHQGMREPTMAELDALAPNNPICVQSSNFHVVYASSKALRIITNTDDIAAPPGGQIYKDKGTGLPWKFQEAATVALRSAFVASQGSARIEREAKNWMWHYAHSGYTTTSEIGLMPGWATDLEPMIRRAKYPARLVGYERAAPAATMTAPPTHGDDMFRVIGAKFWADGSPFAGNIWTSKPYLNSDIVLNKMGLPRDSTGHMNWSVDDINAVVMKHAALGYQVATHAQGDRAIDATLDAYEAALAACPDAKRPFRLEHCALMTEAQIARALSLGVVASFFLPHLYYWGEMLRDEMFGPERAARYMPAGSAVRAGMRVSYHTDPPMTWPNALLCVHLAVTRRSRAGNVIGEAETVDVATALRGVTIDAAHHLGMDDRVGSIVPGKYADFVILDRNPMTQPPERLLDIQIKGTWLNGREQWNAASGGHKPIDFAVPVFDA